MVAVFGAAPSNFTEPASRGGGSGGRRRARSLRRLIVFPSSLDSASFPLAVGNGEDEDGGE